MTDRVKSTNLVYKGNSLRVDLAVNICQNNSTPAVTFRSREFVINGWTVFQMKLVSSCVYSTDASRNLIAHYNNLIFARFAKKVADDDLTYTITFTSKELGVENKRITSDDDTWRLLHENTKQNFTIDVYVLMDVLPCKRSFASLHEDSELTDFELRGTDGAVRVHRSLLAAASPVFHRMLSGAWRETDKGTVEVSGTTKATLQHLKDYLYAHTLPESGIEQLLLLSSYYMMPDLEQNCVFKLMHDVSAANVGDLLEFAGTYKIKRLMLAILEFIKNGGVSLTDIRMHYLSTPALEQNATNMKEKST